MITVKFEGAVAQNEVGYALCGDKRLMAEIVRVRGERCDMQVFDATTDLAAGDKVVGGFHGLSLARSDARRYPAIDPLDSWSHYNSVIEQPRVEKARDILRKGSEIGQMMKVVGEEGTSLADFTTYLKSEFLDAVYLQQNAFSEADSSTPVERQKIMFDVLEKVLLGDFEFPEKTETRRFFMDLQQKFIDWNDKPFGSDEFAAAKDALLKRIASASDGVPGIASF